MESDGIDVTRVVDFTGQIELLHVGIVVERVQRDVVGSRGAVADEIVTAEQTAGREIPGHRRRNAFIALRGDGHRVSGLGSKAGEHVGIAGDRLRSPVVHAGLRVGNRIAVSAEDSLSPSDQSGGSGDLADRHIRGSGTPRRGGEVANLAPGAEVGARATIRAHIHVVGGVVVQIGECVRMGGNRLRRTGGDICAGGHDHHFPIGLVAAGHPVDVRGSGRDVGSHYVRGLVAKRCESDHQVIQIDGIGAGGVDQLQGDVIARTRVVSERHIKCLESASCGVVDGLQRHEGRHIGRINHHTHLNTGSGAGSGAHLERDLQGVDGISVHIDSRQHGNVVRGTAAVEIEGSVAAGVVAAAHIRIGRGGGIGVVTIPAVREHCATGTHAVKVLHERQSGNLATSCVEGGVPPNAALRGGADGLHIHIVGYAGRKVGKGDFRQTACRGSGLILRIEDGSRRTINHRPFRLTTACRPTQVSRGGRDVRGLDIIHVQTEWNLIYRDVIHIHITGGQGRDSECDITAGARIAVRVHIHELPGGGGGRCKVLTHLHESAGIVRIGHHTHLDVIRSCGLIGVEPHLQVRHIDTRVKLRRCQIGIVCTGTVEIGGIAAGVVLGGGGVGIVGGGVVGARGPASDHIAGTGTGGAVKVLRIRNIDVRTCRAGACRTPIAVSATAADRADMDIVLRVGDEVADGVRRSHHTFGSPSGLAIGTILQFPGGFRVAGSPSHRDAAFVKPIHIDIGTNTSDRVVARNEEFHVASIGGSGHIRTGRCRVGRRYIRAVIIIMHSPGGTGIVGEELVFTAVIVAGVVVNHQHQVVRAVILERRREHESIPSLRAVHGSGIDLLQTCEGDVVRGTAEGGLGGVA